MVEMMKLSGKQKIVQALKKLMKTKELDKITIKEIVKEAGVNRSTYYYYFYEVEDIIKCVMQLFYDSLSVANLHNENYVLGGENEIYMRKRTETMLRVFEENKDYLQMIRKSKYKDEFYGGLVELMLKIYREYGHYYVNGTDKSKMCEKEKQYWDMSMGYQLVALVECWASRGFEETPEELTELSFKLVKSKVGIECDEY